MNVLITSASRKVNLVRAFQAALAQEGGGKVIAVDASPLAPTLYAADEHAIVPPGQNQDFLAAMLRLCEQRSVRLLIPTRDEELPFFAEHRDDFQKVNTTVMVSDSAAIDICQDKRRFVEFCRENGFATPENYTAANPADIRFPLFAKPRRGKGGRQATRIDSQAELELTLKQLPDAILQEFIEAPEYTVDFFADFSGRAISAVPRERIFIFGGESFISRTSRNHALIEQSVKLAAKLRLVGHNTIQCFFADNTARFIEVNPRFGGAANLSFAAGAPSPLFLVKLLKGETLEPRIGDFKDNYTMLRYTDDLFLDAASLADGASP